MVHVGKSENIHLPLLSWTEKFRIISEFHPRVTRLLAMPDHHHQGRRDTLADIRYIVHPYPSLLADEGQWGMGLHVGRYPLCPRSEPSISIVS